MEGSIGLKCDDLYMWQLFPQIFARAGQRARCSQSSDKVSHAFIRLAEDFWPCGLVMCLPVGVVVVLICIPVQLRFFSSQFTRRENCAIRAFAWIGQYKFSAE